MIPIFALPYLFALGGVLCVVVGVEDHNWILAGAGE